MDPPIEIEDSPDQTDYPIILVDVFKPVEIDLPIQTDEASREKRRNWVDNIWNIDSRKFPLLKYRIRHGKDPKKDSVVWKQQKVADILRKHFSGLKAIKTSKDPAPSVTIKKEPDSTPPPCQLEVEMEALDAEFRKPYSYNTVDPAIQKKDSNPSLKRKSTSSTGQVEPNAPPPPPKVFKRKLKIPKSEPEPDNSKIVLEPSDDEEQVDSLKRKSTSSTGQLESNVPPKVFKRKLKIPKSEPEPDNSKIVLEPSDDEEQVDYRKTYVFPEDTSVNNPSKPCSSTTGLRMTVETSSCKRKVEATTTTPSISPPEQNVQLDSSDLRNTIDKKLREAKLQSMYVPKVTPDVCTVSNNIVTTEKTEYTNTQRSAAYPPRQVERTHLSISDQDFHDTCNVSRYDPNVKYTKTSPITLKRGPGPYYQSKAPMYPQSVPGKSSIEFRNLDITQQPHSAHSPIRTPGNEWENSKNSLDQFSNRKGKNLFSVPCSQKSAKRDCLLCPIKTKDMKKHTILNHLSNTWWGAYGPYTCWRCQEFHPGGDISTCGGQYKRSDLPTFLYRNECLESFLKEDLECTTDNELIHLIRRNGLCDRSGSNFSYLEEGYLHEIDTNKRLSYMPIYSATKPTRVSELYHWRTISEIMKFSETRGVITGTICPSQPIWLIDSMVKLPEPYLKKKYREDLSTFIKANSPFPNKTISVITDVSGNQLLDQEVLNNIMADKNIKLSVGISPKDADICSNLHIQTVERLLTEPKSVSIGSTGLDSSKAAPLATQESIFTTMMKIAKKTKKPIQIFSKGSHVQTLRLMMEHLPKKHKIHYSNPMLNYNQATDFLHKFPGSYIGIFGRNVLVGDIGHEMIQKLHLSRIIPASYAFMEPTDASLNRFDLERIVIQIGIIKGVTRHEVAKNVRVNIKNLYQF